MTHLIAANKKLARLIDHLKTTGGFLIDAQIVEGVSDSSGTPPIIYIHLSGEDAFLFVRDNGELLKAIHNVAAAALNLSPDQQDLLWFDVNNMRSDRMDQLRRIADAAVSSVRATEKPYAFAPMLSCERYMLRQALASSGLKAESSGEGDERCVVLYPSATDCSEDLQAPPLVPSSGPSHNAA